MIDLRRRRFGVLACFGPGSALDDLAASPPGGSRPGRVAPDELLLVAPDPAGPAPDPAGPTPAEPVPAALEGAVIEARRLLGPEALVVDVSDGWAGWSLLGERAERLFTGISDLPLGRRGFLQGMVAGVPAKVFVEGDGFDLLVPAMWESAVHQRLLDEGRPFGIREVESGGWSG